MFPKIACSRPGRELSIPVNMARVVFSSNAKVRLRRLFFLSLVDRLLPGRDRVK
jgi:hypothetical protein